MNQTESIRQLLKDKIIAFITQDTAAYHAVTRWKEPFVGFADAKGDTFTQLKDVVIEGHYLPQDFLPEATVVVSYFLPFVDSIPQSNIGGRLASEQWSTAYAETNAMVVRLNEHLVTFIEKMGYKAAIPQNVSLIPGVLKSYWSQRHIAYLAGLGTFGVNNMLITEQGCCGRVFSLVTTLPVDADKPQTGEACLNKRNGSCGLCIKACPQRALEIGRFNRVRCFELCCENEVLSGSDVCGKCLVGLPCSTQNPSAS